MDTLFLPDILNRELVWLIGHDHPDIWITSPVQGNTYTSSPIAISWYDSAYGGSELDTIRIEYSPNSGQAWIPLVSGTFISPYDWDLGGVENGIKYRIRITVADKNIYPSLKGAMTTGDFTIRIPGNDHVGPTVKPQSIKVGHNPMVFSIQDTIMEIMAEISDSLSGISKIQGANWSIGYNPVPPGFGDPMNPHDGMFDQVLEKVIDTVRFIYSAGTVRVCSLWVWAEDSLNNWGNALMRTFTVLDAVPILIGAEENNRKIPLFLILGDPVPNPFTRSVMLKYALPKPGKISLKIYNCLGQLVRILDKKTVQPGFYQAIWDGRDDLGRRLADGVFFCQFIADDYVATKKIVLVK
jgi:hypothetical protein